MTMADGVCECCNRQGPLVGVACIPYTPMSIAWCRECLQQDAMPYWTVEYHFQNNGGKLQPLVTHTFKDGKYITWEEAVAAMKVDPPLL